MFARVGSGSSSSASSSSGVHGMSLNSSKVIVLPVVSLIVKVLQAGDALNALLLISYASSGSALSLGLEAVERGWTFVHVSDAVSHCQMPQLLSSLQFLATTRSSPALGVP